MRTRALLALAAAALVAAAPGAGRADDPRAALSAEAEAYGPRPAPYFQQLPIRLTFAHTFVTAANSPYGGHSTAAVLNAGYIEGLLKPQGPALSIQKVDTDLTSPSMPRDAARASMAAQDAGVAVVEGGTVEAHSRATPEGEADALIARAALGGGAVVARSIGSHSIARVEDSLATTTATSTLKDIDIAGVVHIGSVTQVARATSTGYPGGSTARAHLEIAGLTVAGNSATLDESGVHAAGQDGAFSPNVIPADALASAGISMRLVQATTTIAADGRNVEADSGGIVVTFLRTVGVPVDGTPQQDAGVELTIGGARAAISGAPIVVRAPTPRVRQGRPPEVTRIPHVTLPPPAPARSTIPAVVAPPAQGGPLFRVVRIVLRHFDPAQTAGFLALLLAGILGPLVVFRRNPLAAAVLAAPARGYTEFLRYLIRG